MFAGERAERRPPPAPRGGGRRGGGVGGAPARPPAGAPVGVRDQDPTLLVQLYVDEVQQVPVAAAGRTGGADRALLDPVGRRGVGQRPARTALVGDRDAQGPDALEVGRVLVVPAG